MALQDLWLWLRDGIGWRWNIVAHKIERLLATPDAEWVRYVMDRETTRIVRALPYAGFRALEISGSKWQNFGFASYRSVAFDEYDVCAGPLESGAFDLVIAEQVLEHVLWPYRAVKNVRAMLRPGGWFLVTTPFLVKIHGAPVDCSRWTERGLKHLLAEGGFPLDQVQTGSWGNRACVRGSFLRVPRYVSWWHSLRNEPNFPQVVWALARTAG
jgi:SAM-dependent methyltransferase